MRRLNCPFYCGGGGGRNASFCCERLEVLIHIIDSEA